MSGFLAGLAKVLISFFLQGSNSARHRSWDICPPISQIVLKNFMKIILISKECHEDQIYSF
jgi:hypothetical protein